MQTLLLLSVVIVAVAAPTLAARARSARTGLTRAILAVALFTALYVMLLATVYPRLFVPGGSP